MSLKKLVYEAIQASPEFRRKYYYWTLHRRKKPDLEWLMPQLEKALGTESVENAAQAEIERRERESESVHELKITLGEADGSRTPD